MRTKKFKTKEEAQEFIDNKFWDSSSDTISISPVEYDEENNVYIVSWETYTIRK